MIAISQIKKSYGSINVLENIDLEIKAGRITAIVGPNGSGKTTLVKIILGLVKQDKGNIKLEGEQLNGDYSYRRQIGYMPQTSHFPDNLRVREVIDFVRKLRRGSQHRYTKLIELFSLLPEMDKKILNLSGGTRQKLNATIAFMFNPKILILDEPTAGLDPLSSRRMKHEIRLACESGTTIIITTHIISEIEELAQDVVFLCEHRVRFSGTIESLKKDTGQSGVEDALAALMENE